MAEREQSKQPTHYVYSVIKREGKEDFWLNLGVVLPHKDGKGFSIFTNAWPHDGKLVCREVTEDDKAGAAEPEQRSERRGRGSGR